MGWRWRDLFLIGTFLAAERHGAAALTDCATLPTGATWCKDSGGATLEAPAGLSSLGVPRTWIPNNSTTGALTSLDSATGAVVNEFAGMGSITNRPMPVRFNDGTVRVFVATNNGYVWAINQDGTCAWKTFIGRTTATTIHFTDCSAPGPVAECPSDQVTATPAVKFGMGTADSVVYVGTRYTGTGACATTTRNRVYALRASDGAPVWVFNQASTGNPYRNANGAYDVNFIAEGAFPDVWNDGCSGTGPRNRLYVGSAAAGMQHTLWALDASTGAPVWSVDTGGSVETIPMMSYVPDTCGRLYVQTRGGVGSRWLRAYGITSAACGGLGPVPCLIWREALDFQPSVNFSLMQYGTYRGRLFLTKNAGPPPRQVRVIRDTGTAPELVCTLPTSGTSPSPRSMAMLTTSSFFVGATSMPASVVQARISDCAVEGTRHLGNGTFAGEVGMDANTSFTSAWVVVGNDAGRVVRFNIPFSP